MSAGRKAHHFDLPDELLAILRGPGQAALPFRPPQTPPAVRAHLLWARGLSGPRPIAALERLHKHLFCVRLPPRTLTFARAGGMSGSLLCPAHGAGPGGQKRGFGERWGRPVRLCAVGHRFRYWGYKDEQSSRQDTVRSGLARDGGQTATPESTRLREEPGVSSDHGAGQGALTRAPEAAS